MNVGLSPEVFMASSICGPPPWTTTGRIPTSLIRMTSWITAVVRAGSTMALPPYFTTTVFPWKARM